MRTNLYSLRSNKEELAYIKDNIRKIAITLDERSSIRLLFKTEIDPNPRKIMKDFAIDLNSDNPPEFYIYANALDTQDSSSLRRLMKHLVKACEKALAENLYLSKGQKVDIIAHPVKVNGEAYNAYCMTLMEKKLLLLPRMAFIKGDYIDYICNAVNRAKDIFQEEFEKNATGYLVSDQNSHPTLPLEEEEDTEEITPASEESFSPPKDSESKELPSKELPSETMSEETAETVSLAEESAEEEIKEEVPEEKASGESSQKFEELILGEVASEDIEDFEISVSDTEEEAEEKINDCAVISIEDESDGTPEKEEKESEESEPKKGKLKRFFLSFIPHKGDTFAGVIFKIIVLLAIVAFFVGAYMLINFYLIKPAVNSKDMEEIREVFYSEPTIQIVATNDEGEVITLPETASRNWDGVKEINDEIIGWITVKNTKIDYPVLWHKGDNADSQYYLYRNYKEKPSDFGSIFLDYRCENGTNCKNIILHGHNMGSDSSMFAQLTKYPGSTKFYRNAPIVSFDTPEFSGEWIIFSVMKIDVTNSNKTIFNYFLSEFDSDARFMNFVYNIKCRSYLDINVPINENDRIITLSTCSYEGDNMRTVVVARQIREGENVDEYINTVEERYPQHTVYTTFSEALSSGEVKWYDGKGNLEGDETLEYLPVSDSYTVKFLDAKGNEISTQIIIKGKDAEPPEENPRKAASDGYYYVFKKWDQSYKNVTKDLTISPVFTKHKLNIVLEETTWATDPNDYRDTSDEEEPVTPEENAAPAENNNIENNPPEETPHE